MRVLYSLPVIVSAGVASAEVLQRGLSTDGANFASKTFDYVIIGGGTAGLTLAARLSENPKITVGVIETGEYHPDDPLIDTPGSAFSIAGNAKYDWLFKSAPQVNAGNRVLNLPRGKMLGGSSGINIMTFDRGSKVEYDAWAKLGNPGWDWDGLLPNMKSAERFTGIDPFRLNYTDASPNDIFPSQGKNGVIATSYDDWYSDIVPPFRKSMANLGVPINFDPDSGNAVGIFNSATSVNRTTGRRSYAASTYYAYNAHRPNFVVLTGAQATKINFKDSSNSKTKGLVATGVSFMHQSQTYTVKVRKEVIISAGTFQSPHLLELSGIGNSTILQRNGIKTIIDLPGVGKNYQDHVFVTTTYELKPGSSTQNFDLLTNNATYAAAAAAQYNSTHDGILSSPTSVLSFISLDSLASSTEIEKMTAQLDREIALGELNQLQRTSYKIQKEWLKEKLGWVEVIVYPGYAGVGVPKANTSYFTLFTAFQHPFSRGNIHINTSNPLVAPRIDPKFLSKSIDLDTLVYAVKFNQKLSKTEPLASLILSQQSPTPEVTSDADIADYVKANAASIHHPIGTVSLAPREIGGVVDVRLKVYGTVNVRVVDASVMPLHIGSHLQRTVYGIAEKAANMIHSGY
ncbi:glucose dehydrogenase [Rhizoctonia solani 123E]|uniref:Glucose dehydrogenase n=1 Tax=Rhizoctonia solani 123E TaxID=1423351 RepID=A0A074RQ47_9AGAM|nr:glucose dehydrogenase [Rhizoctonia solani 123E]